MKETPQNLKDLEQRFSRIMAGKENIKLSPRNINILKQMLDDPGGTSVKTITELANEFDVHRSSLTRLAQKLQYDGFPSFQAVFRQELKGKKNFYSKQVHNFLHKEKATDTQNDSTIQKITKNEWSNLMVMLENYDEAQFNAVADLLYSAKRVNIMGLRGCYPISYFLGYYLKMIRDDVTIIGMGGHILAEEIASLLPGDLLLAISGAPYTKNAINSCKIAKEMGVELAVITDSQFSPLINYADHLLLGSMQSNHFFASLTSSLIYAEALLSEVVKKYGKKAIQKLKQNEYLFSKLGVEFEQGDSFK